ncbi:putative leucine-rich repeat domain, L domain-containing protein [Medicago truncatula]|uniref:Putative leucine-rich repeat domain, L domain-containing protein n=1 Tax=Medicago truncatula TaxID=3880 RepID=A0A396IAK2_MEDTR|nr:putative leucine-rich repeat domain, L domain-containing protein [Medicago truncatula]
MLHSSRFSTIKQFTTFVSKILTLHHTSTALHKLDLDRRGDIEPQLLKKILNYVTSHNTHLHELGISVRGDSSLIMRCVSSCHALTSLKLSLYPRGSTHIHNYTKTLFPKSLNFPFLTTLYLENFAFCGSENGCAEPFFAFTKLNSLVISSCEVKDAQILNISSETLVNLALHDNLLDFVKFKLSAPSLCTFTFTGDLLQKIYGSSLSSIKQVNIDAQEVLYSEDSAMVLLSLLQDLANVESLAVTSTTLQILSLVPDLLEVKFHSLCNLKSLEVELIPLQDGYLSQSIKNVMYKKAAAKSHEELLKLCKAFKRRMELPAIPDGIVDFLRQNSPSAEVNITTDYFIYFNLKQVASYLKTIWELSVLIFC